MEITLDNIQFPQDKPFNGKTQEYIIPTSGGGNMFGGSGEGVHIIIHGDNSALKPTGTIEVKGYFHHSMNIARGANGPYSGNTSYYSGAANRDEAKNLKPTFTVKVEGNCSSGASMVAAILNKPQAFKK